MLCLSLLFCSVFMGICVWGAQLYWLQAEAHGLSGAIQQTIGRHEDGQGWGERNLENIPKGHDNMVGGFLFYFYFNCVFSFFGILFSYIESYWWHNKWAELSIALHHCSEVNTDKESILCYFCGWLLPFREKWLECRCHTKEDTWNSLLMKQHSVEH